MSRFPSFNHVPSETRRILRDRFASKLRVVRQGRFLDPDLKVTPDQLVLRLLAGLKVSSNAEWPTAEIAYAKAGPTDSEPPDLQALANLGWVRRIWGRAEIGRDLRLAARRAPAGVMDAFEVLLSGIHGQRYEASVAVRSDPELADLVEAIEAGRSDRDPDHQPNARMDRRQALGDDLGARGHSGQRPSSVGGFVGPAATSIARSWSSLEHTGREGVSRGRDSVRLRPNPASAVGSKRETYMFSRRRWRTT